MIQHRQLESFLLWDKSYLFYIVNIIAADDLATPEAEHQQRFCQHQIAKMSLWQIFIHTVL